MNGESSIKVHGYWAIWMSPKWDGQKKDPEWQKPNGVYR